MDATSAALMALSTGSAAGLRPYLTILVMGLAKAFVPLSAPEFVMGTINQIPEIFANYWLLGIAAILALLDFLGDKVWGYSAFIETVNQFLRPLLAAGLGVSLGVLHGVGFAVGTMALSMLTSIPVSLGKSAVTFASNALPEGISQILRSMAEDGNALVLVILAIIAPIFAVIFALVAGLIGLILFFTLRKVVRVLRVKFANFRANRETLQAERAAEQQSGQRRTLKDMWNLKAILSKAQLTPAVATSSAHYVAPADDGPLDW